MPALPSNEQLTKLGLFGRLRREIRNVLTVARDEGDAPIPQTLDELLAEVRLWRDDDDDYADLSDAEIASIATAVFSEVKLGRPHELTASELAAQQANESASAEAEAELSRRAAAAEAARATSAPVTPAPKPLDERLASLDADALARFNAAIKTALEEGISKDAFASALKPFKVKSVSLAGITEARPSEYPGAYSAQKLIAAVETATGWKASGRVKAAKNREAAKPIYIADDGETWWRSPDFPDYAISNHLRLKKFAGVNLPPRGGVVPSVNYGKVFFRLRRGGVQKKLRADYLLDHARHSAIAGVVPVGTKTQQLAENK